MDTVTPNTPPAQPADAQPIDNLAECGACGRNKPVCCDEGYSDDPETGVLTHVGAVCVECCRPHHKGGARWHGKSVAGGTYELSGVEV